MSWKFVFVLSIFMSCLLHCTDCHCGCTKTCTGLCVNTPTACVDIEGMVHDPSLRCCGGKTCCVEACDYLCQGYGGECFSNVTHDCAFEIIPASLCGRCPGLTGCCTRGTLSLKVNPG